MIIITHIFYQFKETCIHRPTTFIFSFLLPFISHRSSIPRKIDSPHTFTLRINLSHLTKPSPFPAPLGTQKNSSSPHEIHLQKLITISLNRDKHRLLRRLVVGASFFFRSPRSRRIFASHLPRRLYARLRLTKHELARIIIDLPCIRTHTHTL